MEHNPLITRWKLVFTIALLAIATGGCSGPLGYFPGGALSGPEAPLDLTTLPAEGGVIELETNPADPYSVNVGFVVIAGNMYIDPADGRTWYEHIEVDPAVRLRFAGDRLIRPATAVRETDSSVLAQFEADRNVLRLEPRS